MEPNDNNELPLTKKIHFISGLPRSGSTLLTAIFNQNPRFNSNITDPLAVLVKGTVEASQTGAGSKAAVPEDRVFNSIRGLVNGFYHSISQEVVFNTNRGWTVITPLVKRVFPGSKILLCVRDINWILDSFELAHRRNPLAVNSTMGGLSQTVYSRVTDLMSESGIVGFPYVGLKQAITSNERDIIMLVEYDDLCKNPKSIMEKIYKFIDEPYFDHDFDNVESSWDEYDREIGIPLHNVKKKVQYKSRNSILPPDIQAKFKNMEVWRMMK